MEEPILSDMTQAKFFLEKVNNNLKESMVTKQIPSLTLFFSENYKQPITPEHYDVLFSQLHRHGIRCNELKTRLATVEEVIKDIHMNIADAEQKMDDFKMFLNNTKLKYGLQGLTKDMIQKSCNQNTYLMDDAEREILNQPYQLTPFRKKGGKTNKRNKKRTHSKRYK
jgi:hypothetical protein